MSLLKAKLRQQWLPQFEVSSPSCSKVAEQSTAGTAEVLVYEIKMEITYQMPGRHSERQFTYRKNRNQQNGAYVEKQNKLV